MFRKHITMRFLFFSLLTGFFILSASAQNSEFSNQPPRLIENMGQLSNSDGSAADQVLYYMNTPAIDFYITKDGVSYVFKKAISDEAFVADPLRPEESAPIKEVAWHRVDASLEGAQINPKNVEVVYSKQSTISIFNERVPQGLEHLRPVKSVTLKNVYPGIDWQFVAENDFLKYNFILHEGADVSAIKVQFKGQDKISLNNNSLLIETSLGSLKENPIVAFTSSGKTTDVQAVLTDATITYQCSEIPKLQNGETWIIDPPLVWGTYFGGSLNDRAIIMERNSNGYIYVLIETYSTDFPLLNQGGLSFYQGSLGGTVDVGISKFTEDGVLVWSCYYGGSGDDKPSNLFYNGTVLLIVGSSRSADFPTMSTGLPGAYYDNTLGGAQDGFVIAFTIGDARIWGTYLGGSSDYDNATDCTYNDMKIFVVGHTYTDFPLVAAAGAYNQSVTSDYDAFITEFNTTFAVTWSTLYGGSVIDNNVYCDIDSANRLVITFNTTSSDIPLNNTMPGSFSQAHAGGVDLGIAMFNNSRQLIWSTYYGSAGNEWANDVVCDQQSNWYFVGNSNHAGFPVVNSIGASFYQSTSGGLNDGVILKFDSVGQRLYSGFYGGNANDAALGITIDSKRNIYVVGYANSTLALQTYNPNDGSFYDGTQNGGADEFLMELDSNFTLKWATYVGGAGEDILMDVRVSPSDHVFAVGYTRSAAHPLLDMTPGTSYYDGVINAAGSTAYRDAIIMKFIPCPDDFNTIHFTDSVCEGETTLLYATGSHTYTWSTGSVNDSIQVVVPSDTAISIVATYLTCIERDTVTIVAKPLPVISFAGDSSVCLNDTMTLSANGGVNYVWENGTANDTVVFVPASSENFTIQVTNAYSCTSKDSVAITVHPLPVPGIAGPAQVCRLDTISIAASGGTSYVWNTSESTGSIDVSWPLTGTYDYWVIATDANNCADTAFHQIDVLALPEFSLGNDTTICAGTSIVLNTGVGGAAYSWNTGAASSSITINSALEYIATVTDANFCSWSDSIVVGVQPLPTITFSGDSVICYEDSIHLSAGGGVVYAWENGMTGSNIAFVPTGSDELSVSVTDAFLCTSVDSVAFTVLPLPVPVISGDSVVCRNDTASWTAAGGIDYVWSNTWTGATVSVPLQVQGTHIYYVIATGANGCSDTAFHQVLVHPLPEFSLGSDTTLCQGNSLLLAVSATATSYNWSTGETSSSISVNTANNYSAEATDVNNCHFSDTIQVAVIPWSNATITDIAYVCENAVPFDFNAAETGGVWSGNGISSTANGTFVASAAGVGFHNIIYTISGLCGDSDSSLIEVAEAPVGSFISTNETCQGAADGTLEINVSGGQTPYVYLLDTAYIADSNTGVAPGFYLLSVVDNRGCLWTDSVFILSEAFPCGEVDFYIPNIFSPNADGKNDILFVRSNFIDVLLFVVYDRYGEKVFETTDPLSGWDGTYQGQPVVAGVYYYYVRAGLRDGNSVEKEGNVTLQR